MNQITPLGRALFNDDCHIWTDDSRLYHQNHNSNILKNMQDVLGDKIVSLYVVRL